MLHDEGAGLGLLQRLPDALPVHRPVTHVRPAVFIGVLAGRCDVLDVGRCDAVGVAFDPDDRVGPAAHDPGDVRLPIEGRPALEDQRLRNLPARQLLELEVVIVPAVGQARPNDRLASLLKTLAEFAPPVGIAGPLVDGDVRTVDSLHAELLCNVQDSCAVLLDHVEGEVAGGHLQALRVELPPHRGCILVHAAIAFHLLVAEVGEHLKRRVQRGKFARGVELVGEVRHGRAFRGSLA